MTCRVLLANDNRMTHRVLAYDVRVHDDVHGAGIAHASRSLFEAMQRVSERFLIRVLPVRSREELKQVKQEAGTRYVGLFAPTGSAWAGELGPVFPWIHDLYIMEHPEWFSESWLRRTWTIRKCVYGIERADRVFAVSAYTRMQVARLTNASADRIIVTSEGVDDCMGDMLSPADKHACLYALALGTVEPRKNLEWLCDTWIRAMRAYRLSVPLVIAGQAGWGGVRLPNHPLIQRREHVNDQQRIGLLKQAWMVLTPSLGEGFGRVPLEAWACGTPALVSACGALPETVPDSACVAPLDPRVWESRIAELITRTDDAYLLLASKGKYWAEQFTWEKTATTILAEFENS